MKPGEPAKELKDLGLHIARSSLHDEVVRRSPDEATKQGLGFALHDLWATAGYHPLEIAAFAMENGNYHGTAQTLRDTIRYTGLR